MKTLAMIKMEKNFVAHIEKGYPRQPYKVFSCHELLRRLSEEWFELKEALKNKNCEEAMKECADLSNIVDYIFEKLSNGEIE